MEGYYTIGMKGRGFPVVFEQISWRSPVVFDQTIRKCTENSLKYSTIFPTLRDVDVPEDVRVWDEIRKKIRRGSIEISVIIPVLNESKDIRRVLEHLWKGVGRRGGVEVIVVDGGSED